MDEGHGPNRHGPRASADVYRPASHRSPGQFWQESLRDQRRLHQDPLMNNNIISYLAAAAPLAGLLLGMVVAAVGKTDMATGASGIGAVFRGYLALAAVCTVGEIAGLVGLYRGYRPTWLCWLAAVLNGLIILPGLLLLFKMDWD